MDPSMPAQTLEVTIVWQNIVVDFYAAFVDSFRNNKKAHFDCLPPPFNLVDGARSKWCIPQLLDVLIYFHENDAFKPAVRREFNQQRVLADCLLKELQFQCSTLESFRSESHSNITINVHMESIVHPWNHIDSVRTIVVQCPPSKSKKKYVEVVNHLCCRLGSIVPSGDLTHVIKRVMSKLLCGLDSRTACHRRPSVSFSPESQSPCIAVFAAEKLLELSSLELPVASSNSPDGKPSDDSSIKEEGCPLMTQMGHKRRSSSIRSVTSVSSADGDYIAGTFQLTGSGTGTSSNSPLNMTIPSSHSEEAVMYECDSLPDVDMPMDCDEAEHCDGRKSDFEAFIESSGHSTAVMFAASPMYIESPPRVRGRLTDSDNFYERSFSRRSSSRRSSANTVGSNTTLDSTSTECYSYTHTNFPVYDKAVSSIMGIFPEQCELESGGGDRDGGGGGGFAFFPAKPVAPAVVAPGPRSSGTLSSIAKMWQSFSP